jgi:hypothetical protein
MRAFSSLIAAAALVACASNPPPTQRQSRAPSDPREQLDKADIVAGMGRIKPRVGECFDRFHRPGVFSVALTIASSGRVASVHVTGPDLETGNCIGVAVAKATFPPFTGEPQSIVYPFVFRLGAELRRLLAVAPLVLAALCGDR